MRISDTVGLDFEDVLIIPQRSEGISRSQVDLIRRFKGKHSDTTFECIPIIASNMYATGSLRMYDALRKHQVFTALHKYHDCDEWSKFITREDIVHSHNFFITTGENHNDLCVLLRWSGYLYGPIFINIDVANGYRSSFVDYVKRARDNFPRDIIMVGNVCTAEMTSELILAGADIVKIGIGPGSVCKTRLVTGVGYPQLSAIIECANAAHNLKGYICADGGCKTSGDVCKAFCAGADFVMLGGMLAGTAECDGEWSYYTYGYTDTSDNYRYKVSIGDKKTLKFYGMSSREAMEAHGGLEKEYRASEGECIEVPYKGSAENVIKEILGGLRSCGTYIGAMEIKHFPKHANFVRT